MGEAAIVDRLEQLRKRFDRCDKKALVFRTMSMINKVRSKIKYHRELFPKLH